MQKFAKLILLLGLVPLSVNTLSLASHAQTTDNEQVTRTLSLEKAGTPPQSFSINGEADKVNPAATVGAITLAAGITIDASQTGINLALAGADPESVANLMLALSGMIPDGQTVNPSDLALAINAFNSMISKADAQTLTAMQNNVPEFGDIRNVLYSLRACLSDPEGQVCKGSSTAQATN